MSDDLLSRATPRPSSTPERIEEAYQARLWAEYDAAAKWCAQRRYSGGAGSPLPEAISVDVCDLIDQDIEAFQERVRATAYMLAREGRLS